MNRTPPFFPQSWNLFFLFSKRQEVDKNALPLDFSGQLTIPLSLRPYRVFHRFSWKLRQGVPLLCPWSFLDCTPSFLNFENSFFLRDERPPDKRRFFPPPLPPFFLSATSLSDLALPILFPPFHLFNHTSGFFLR